MTTDGAITTIVNFNGADAFGEQPLTPLALGADGNFYGATWAGGSGGGGTIFRMSPAGTLTALHAFPSSATDGLQIEGPILGFADGSVIGTTSVGGFSQTAGTGTVFTISAAGAFSTLYYFPYTATNVISGLTQGTDGTLYAVTMLGGAGTGQIFSITQAGSFSALHTFACSCSTPDGAEPVGSLTLASDGYLYGATIYGGTANRGTLFRMTTAGVVTPLHSFAGADGDQPSGGLIEGLDGRFYGATTGVFSHTPTVFSLTLAPESAPANLAATAQDGSAILTWNAARTADSYNVYEGTAAAAEATTPVLSGVTATTATATGLKNGSKYFFTVAAVNESGVGPASAEVSVEPIGSPTGLQATAGNGSVTLSWSAGVGASTYNVYTGKTSGAESATPTLTAIGATSATVTGLANGTTYYFKVASVSGTSTVMATLETSGTPTAGSSGGSGGGGAMDPGVLAILAAVSGCLRLCRRRANSPA